MISYQEYISIFFLSLLTTLLALPIWIELAKRTGLMDHPHVGKLHGSPVPTAGGACIVFSFYLTLWLFHCFYGQTSPLTERSLMGLSVAGAIIFCLGVFDDMKNSGFMQKLVFQSVAAFFLCYYGFGFQEITNPLGDALPVGFLSYPVTILWVVLVINSINLIDGMDGLACGIIFIASTTTFLIAVIFGEKAIIIPSLILAGACLGFLRYNFPPARVFLGDTGSMFLGLIMAAISLMGKRKGSVTATLLLPMVLLAIPLIDTVLAFFRRSWNKQNPFKRDLQHLHHRFLSLGLSQKRIVLFFYLLCVYLSLTALAISIMPKQQAFLVLLILAIGMLIGMEVLRFLEYKFETEFSQEKNEEDLKP